jgi:transmembrane sensor
MKKEECLNIFEKYILNTATTDEVKQLSHWIKHNSKISGWLEHQILNSSNEIDKNIQMRMLLNIKSEIDEKTPIVNKSSRNVRFHFKAWLRIAAMFALPILAAAAVYVYMSRSDITEPLIVSVDRGQKACVTLPDGSKAWLNSLSKLTYNSDYNKEKRTLQLDGEAYFEVAHNPQKPFIVRSNDISVEALGTSFGVKAYNEDIEISSILMKGKVRVTTPAGITILKPNERVLYDKTNKIANKSKVTNAIDFTGWIHNELRFENESLGEIAKNIQRIYNVKIIFASERLKKLRYTGTVENNSLESVLNIITLTSPISFQVDKETVMLFENQNLMQHYNQ